MRPRFFPLALLFTALLALLSGGAAAAPQERHALPEMGDSSATLLSREEEMRIGAEMMRQLRRNGMVVDDPVVSQYIESVGRNLAASAVTDRNHFHFFVVDAPSINAFAMPGGYIGVHSGLILASESESELAAVLAHEIAHVTQHHIARSVEKANQMNLPVTAAVIAAILLGGGDPQVAQAALATSLGASSQMQLDFTRSNEKEADRIGMQLLATTDFDPRGMGGFFGKLQAQSRYYGKGVPEFLRTHPVTISRIAEAEDRARQYPASERNDSIHYHLSKARLRLQLAESLDRLSKELEAEQPATPRAREANSYLRALITLQQKQFDQARKALLALRREHPDRITYMLTLGELEHSQQRYARAQAVYQEGLEQYPANPQLTLALARTLLADGEIEKARSHLESLLRERNQREGYRLLAKLEAQSGNRAASHLAQAEYLYLSGELHSAIDQLNSAQRIDPLPHYYATRIESRLEQIKSEATLQRGR
ncbi:MAG: M48 family metalloprotease [Pseudomonadota bacterium]